MVALPAAARIARAQAYPTRSVRLIVGAPPAGPVDISARLIAQWLSDQLGHQFIVDNRPGAGGNIGTEAVVHAPADGYTLLMAYASNAINATLYDRLNYNFVRDIAPVGDVNSIALVMEVHPSFPAKSVPELIAYAKANPGKLNMASPGTGTGPHLAGELFKKMAGVDMIHVPYRGSGPMLADLLGGQVQAAFDGLSSSIEYIKAGRLRALAVATASRSPALPDIPALSEYVPGYEASGWCGVGAPRGTPTDIIDRLNHEINAGLADVRIKARFADLGEAVLPGSAADFGKFIAEETAKWANVVKFSGAKPD